MDNVTATPLVECLMIDILCPTDPPKTKPPPACTDEGLNVVVEYSTMPNTHPEGVSRAVPGLPPNEEYGVHPRICPNHLTGSENALKVCVSIVCVIL